MSNYYLCDTCDQKVLDLTPSICVCSTKGWFVQKIAVYDGPERPEKLCDDYEQDE